MLIQSLEQKTRLALLTVFLAVTSCTVICAFTIYYAAKLITDERQQIYLIDGQIPFLAERSKQEANFLMEAKAHIQLFHQYFFNLPPDDDYIKWTLGKAMYMADATAMKQKQAMEENGFYSVISSLPLPSALSSVTASTSTSARGSLPTMERSSLSAVAVT
jgi:conjugative transposon TraK protein